MIRRFFLILLYGFGVLSLRPSSFLRASEPGGKEYRRSFGIGLAYTGLLFRKGFKKDYSAEAHYLFGQADSGDDDVSAHLFGLRGYRHFRTDRRLQLFTGMEAAYVYAANRVLGSNGYTAGGFAGIEYYLSSRFSVGFDAGPYYFWFKEDALGTSGGGVDFILSTSVNFYIF